MAHITPHVLSNLRQYIWTPSLAQTSTKTKMNKQYITAVAALLLAAGTTAQTARMHLPKGVAPKMATPLGTANMGQAKGACVLSEDFESTTIGTLTGAGWDDGPQIETQNDNTGVGTGTFVDAWVIDVASNANNGGYFPIPDEPTLNKFAYLNDDGDPCNCDMNDVGLATPSMDFTGLTDMTVGFRAYSDENFGGGDASVEVSTNGGASYTTVFTIPAVEGEWQEFVVDLSAFDGAADVRVRFAWTDNGAWATGFAVDDICVAPVVPNNLSVIKLFTENVTIPLGDLTQRSIESSVIPLEQVQAVSATARVTNTGGTAQTNVVGTLEVLLNGTSQGTFTSTPIASMDPGDTVMIVINTGWTPNAVGDITLNFSVAADQADDAPSNNSRTRTYEVSNAALANGSNVWARDRGVAGSFSGGVDAYAVANLFESIPAGSTVYGIGVAIGGANEGVLVTAHLFDDGFNALASGEYEIPAGFVGNGVGQGNFTYIPLDAPVDLSAAQDVLGVFEHFGGDTARSANSGTSADTTSFFFDGTDWGWVTFTPMVRLFLGNAVSVAEVRENGMALGANMPNPFNGNTSVQYELAEARNVRFEVRDNEGRLVLNMDLGRRPAGKHLVDFDAAMLASGTYSYTMIAGADRLTRSMVLAR